MHINANILYGTVIALTAVASGCLFGSAKTCIFQCHCDSNDTCDATTGQCPGQCEAGVLPQSDWRGPGCQIGNIAHGKYAVQSPGGNGPATYAVDGSLNTCLRRAYRDDFWWIVTLGSLYFVHNVTIFSRLIDPFVATTFHICVGNTTNVTEHTMCATSDYCTVTLKTITCNSTLYGRYVSVRIDRLYSRAYFCEIVVMGYKQTQAECINCAGVCDDVLGCRECRPGYIEAPFCSKAITSTQNISAVTETTTCGCDIFGSQEPIAVTIVLAILLGLSIVGNAAFVVYFLKNRYAQNSSPDKIPRNNTQQLPATGEYEGLQGNRRQKVSSQYAMMRMQTDDPGYEEVTQTGTIDPEYDQI